MLLCGLEGVPHIIHIYSGHVFLSYRSLISWWKCWIHSVLPPSEFSCVEQVSRYCTGKEDGMGQKDILTKAFMSEPKYFADAFNAAVFGGRQIVKADSLLLEEMDSTELGIVFEDREKDVVQKVRDVLKKCVIMHDGRTTFLILGIENQSDIHYAMPVRNLIYDALNYGKQVSRITAKHRQDRDINDSSEYLSGFKKTDKIMPVITLTVYYGAKEWDAPRCLKDMFPEDISREIMDEVDDYHLHLIVPSEIEDFSKFRTELGTVMKFIAASENPERIEELSRDTAYEQISVETVHLINECAGGEIIAERGEPIMSLCKGIEGYGQKKREEGVMTTLTELVQKGLLDITDAAEQAGMTVEEFKAKSTVA